VIEVFCVESGDRAEAETPRGAITAARVLAAEARDGGCMIRPTVQFFVNGEMIRQYTGVMP
jgi:hypothetical protein